MSTLYGGSGNDSYVGTTSNDLFYGNAGNDSLYGGAGNDTLAGGAGFDNIDGGSGNDELVGGQGNDTFYGGTGDDQVIGDGQWFNPASYSSNSFGSSTTLQVVNNADGPVDLWYINSSGQQVFVKTIAAAETYSFSTLTSSNYFLEDSSGYYLDVIQGGFSQTFSYNPPLNDLIYGGAGNDTIFGQYGNDTIFGEDDNDTIHGGYGSDSIYGGAGRDSLFGDDGNDIVFGGAGDDSADLGSGSDTFGSWANEDGNDTVYGGTGNDVLYGGAGNDSLFGGDGDDWLTGGDGNDTLYGEGGRDSFAVSDDHQGDTIYGGETGDDYDRLTFGNFSTTQGVNVTYTGAEAGNYTWKGSAGQGVFSQIEEVNGTSYADTFDASAATGGVNIYAGAGADSITGSSGNDTLIFGSGDDTVYGGAGNDYIDDTWGSSTSGNNLIYGGAGADTVWAGGDNDTVYGGSESDVVMGEDGNDLLFGDAGDDSVDGGAGNDQLFGGSGNDTLVGGAGTDRLVGGSGNDYLVGGAGNDLFVVELLGGSDVIADFDMTLFGGTTADQLDVHSLTNTAGESVKVWDVSVTANGSGQAVLTFPNGEVVVLQGVSPTAVTLPGALHAMGVPCFVEGCRIATPEGLRAIETIAVGDLVLTWDGRAEPVLWHGVRALSHEDLAAAPRMRPVRFAPIAGYRALRVSPQHGICLPDAGVLARAVHLADCRFASRGGQKAVVYHHLLLPQHELLIAEGRLCESFYPGSVVLAAMPVADRFAILGVIARQANLRDKAVVGDVAAIYGKRCLPMLNRRELMRHLGRKTAGQPSKAQGISERYQARDVNFAL